MSRFAAPRGFYVRGVITARAPHEVVLAHGGDGHELAAHGPPHLARLSLDRARRETTAVEHARVRVVHQLVARAQSVEIVDLLEFDDPDRAHHAHVLDAGEIPAGCKPALESRGNGWREFWRCCGCSPVWSSSPSIPHS